ncbi:MAG: sigma-54 dependent transcriptional regulator [Thermodesulfovibrionales bacterium]|nr:sigma-54 dependent transcriptional regulator [Thermodesulfovibrionales bacterium]
MPNPTALIIDDEEPIRESLSGILEDEGYEVITASSGEEAIEIVKNETIDLIFLDVCLTGIDGIETLIKIKDIVDIPIIMISGHGNIPTAVRAIQLGAYNFLQKPLSYDEITLMAKRALEMKRLLSENRQLKAHLSKKWRLIGESDKVKFLRQQIDFAARSNSRVLITGESGTGKELIARLLHEKSSRADNPFIEVNCAAIPQELIESELFGHERGSFTGAVEKKIGKFELADKGTLFLDEIGDMSLVTQSKVLRVIETQTFQRVGGNRNIKVDTRIIAATNKDLLSEVQKGTFREDLYFRLNVICINCPPLRERLDDIPLLVEYFISTISAETGLKPKEISPEVIKRFQSYSWDGNIRELRNVIERIMIMVPARCVQLEDLEKAGILQTQRISKEYDYFSYKTLKEAKEAFERDYIIRKLRENKWNISKTAEIIAVERSSLHKKIKNYDISEEEVK